MDAHIEIFEDGEPRIAGRRLPVLTVALQVGGTDVTVEEFADAHNLEIEDMEAALSWVAAHPDIIHELIQKRAVSMRGMADRDYPEFVDGPTIDDEDVEDFRERAMDALAAVVDNWSQYGDTRFYCER